jgi:UDP-N-acetylglucosamine:LPS N-acetylglucosamine transferase
MTRILAIASGGGHWTQLRRLRPAFEGLDVAYVSVLASNGEDVQGHRYYTVKDASRAEKRNFLILLIQCAYILLRERPQVVITTGAAPGYIMLVLAKTLLGARTMWIDSIANSEKLSLSGLKAGRFADAWLTQWPALTREGGPDYWGAVM